jgi:hypothetical protein
MEVKKCWQYNGGHCFSVAVTFSIIDFELVAALKGMETCFQYSLFKPVGTIHAFLTCVHYLIVHCAGQSRQHEHCDSCI